MALGLLSLVPLVALGALVGVAEANLTVSPVQVIADDIMGFDESAEANDIAIVEISDRIYAVVAWPDDGVQIIDISDSGTPVLVAAITDGADGFTELGGASDIEIVEISGRTYAVVAAIRDGVQIIDISCPTVPIPAMANGAGDFTEFGGASDIEIVGISGRTYALVTTVEDGVRILQLSGGADSIPASPCPAYNEPPVDVMPPEQQKYREIDVLVYGYNDGVRPITAGHVELLESRGYTVDVSDGPVTAEQVERASVVVGWGLNVQDADAREILTEYVHGGGRLLLLIDTQYSRCGSTENPCWFDFTGDAFGFRFDGDVQSGTLIPAGGSEQHPIWNEPNVLREFSDWCCDGYVGEITDPQNVKVVATVSGQSYKHGAYTPVSGVPAIVVNNNPAWNGGMVVGAGIDMVVGWLGPDMRMFDNMIGFMMSGVDVDMPPEQQKYREIDVLVYGYNDGVRPITAGHVELLESRGYTVDVSDGPVTAEQVERASVVVGWGLNVQDADAREILTEYVHGGGRLLLLIDTQYSRCGSTENPCWFDFTGDAFGFRFDGDVQSGTLIPAGGSEQHPIWNEPNVLREFSDWCCDGYVGEITDPQNVKVVATVSGQSYKHGAYTPVSGVPAIVVNNNPAWNGGMVVGAGIDMVVGWLGPDMRMFDNMIGFMMSGVDVDMPPEQQKYREIDVLVYGYNDGVRPITAGHVELLESRGYTVDVSDGPVTAEQVERASVVVGWGLNVQDADAREILTEYVHGGGRLLLLIDTQYSRCGSTENPCWFDFTGDAFGFRFDGDVQSGTLIPAGGSEQHPIWNEPNVLREFSDWCCDGYVGEITDPQNVKVVATVSGQSYKHGAYTPVSGVPAIVVNNNPAWNGGMVVGAGIDMVVGWLGPDMRMFDNMIGFMMSGVDVDMPPEQQKYREIDVLVYGYNDGVRPITAGHVELLESRGYTVDVSDGPVTAEQVERASVVVGWGLNVQDADAREILTEYVHGGGRLLLLIDTQYSRCGSTENPCWFDFTGDAFGFRFDGDVQSGTLIPAGGSEQHPIWNEPNVLREFSDWCCDGYVGEITDPQNVKVVATVSGQSYKHGAYTPVSGVPAIVVNNNPAWNGGMVVGAGIDMVVGWLGPDMRMFDNMIGFMMSGVDVQ